jgi:hypothetical protein
MTEVRSQRVESARRTRRKRVLMNGVIADISGKRLFDCTLVDISEDGARIRLPAKCQLPASYYLINVPARLAYQAVTVWRNSAQVGIRFANIIPVSGGNDPALVFLRRLWFQAVAG